MARGGTGSEPQLSDVESVLGDRVANFLAERVGDNLADANVVYFNPRSDSPVPDLIRSFLASPAMPLVDMSRVMAVHLHRLQRPISPPGLLLVLDVDIGNRRALVILKVEEEDGVQIASREELTDRRGFRMILQEDLFLTQKTRIYKVGEFSQVDGETRGRVLDKQRGQAVLVAGFFMRFLGCTFGARADLETKTFMDEAESFFNQSITDPNKRTRYETALIAELASHSGDIRIPEFAQRHLDLEDRNDFEERMTQAQLPRRVAKDTSLIRSRLDRVAWVFASGVSVLAPPDKADLVKLEQLAEVTRLVVEDHLQRTIGHGRR